MIRLVDPMALIIRLDWPVRDAGKQNRSRHSFPRQGVRRIPAPGEAIELFGGKLELPTPVERAWDLRAAGSAAGIISSLCRWPPGLRAGCRLG
jgi:hypothetical protein